MKKRRPGCRARHSPAHRTAGPDGDTERVHRTCAELDACRRRSFSTRGGVLQRESSTPRQSEAPPQGYGSRTSPCSNITTPLQSSAYPQVCKWLAMMRAASRSVASALGQRGMCRQVCGRGRTWTPARV